MDIETTLGLRLDKISGQMADLAQAQAEAAAATRERLRGIKALRLPLVTGKAVASALTMGGDTGTVLTSPEQGYAWSIRHLVIEGMASGATPDVINIVSRGRIVWQLNGNQFAQTWGRGEFVLFSGETLTYQSVGTFNSTATIIAHGMTENIPAEMIGKFF